MLTREEYEAKYHANLRYEGYGLETCTVAPCPGCASSDFVKMPLLEPMAELEKGAVCRVCQRSFKANVTSEPNVTRIFMVQTGGPDLPPYLSWIPRV